MGKAQDIKTDKWRFKSWLSFYHFCKLGKVTYFFPAPVPSSVMKMTMATHRFLVKIKKQKQKPKPPFCRGRVLFGKSLLGWKVGL